MAVNGNRNFNEIKNHINGEHSLGSMSSSRLIFSMAPAARLGDFVSPQRGVSAQHGCGASTAEPNDGESGVEPTRTAGEQRVGFSSSSERSAEVACGFVGSGC